MNTTERVRAGDIVPGDRVARARTHEFREVQSVDPGPTSVWLYYGTGRHDRDRPRKTAQWWREVSA